MKKKQHYFHIRLRAHSLKYTSTNSLKIGVDIEIFYGPFIIISTLKATAQLKTALQKCSSTNSLLYGWVASYSWIKLQLP